MIDIKEIFDSYKKTQEKVWAHDRSKTMGASEIFGCIRKGWFEKNTNNKFEKDEQDEPDSWGAALRGDILEEHYVVPALLNAVLDANDDGGKQKLLYAGADQVTLVHNYNSATPDGLWVGLPRDALKKYGVEDIKSNAIIVEIKSIDPRSNLDEEKAVHRGQMQTQMGLIHEKTKWRPYFGIILYVDASFLDQIKVFVVPYEKGMWAAAQKRADIVFNEDDPAKVRPEGKLNDGCKFCKWTKACTKVSLNGMPEDVKKPEELDEETKETFLELMTRQLDLKRQAGEIKEEIEEINMDIKDHLTANGRRWVDVEENGRKFTAKWSQSKGRKTFSQKLAQEAGIDLEPFKVEGDPFETFKVSSKDV